MSAYFSLILEFGRLDLIKPLGERHFANAPSNSDSTTHGRAAVFEILNCTCLNFFWGDTWGNGTFRLTRHY